MQVNGLSTFGLIDIEVSILWNYCNFQNRNVPFSVTAKVKKNRKKIKNHSKSSQLIRHTIVYHTFFYILVFEPV